MVDKVKQGKQNRASGLAFERKVRKDLEEKGWIVCKWSNNIDEGKCIPAKHKFNPFSKVMAMGTGFPDFFAFREDGNSSYHKVYEIFFIECKSNGYLSKIEKEKAEWYLKNGYCSQFMIASKKQEGRKIEVEYKEYGTD